MIRVWCLGKFVGLGFMLQLEKEKQMKSEGQSTLRTCQELPGVILCLSCCVG